MPYDDAEVSKLGKALSKAFIEDLKTKEDQALKSAGVDKAKLRPEVLAMAKTLTAEDLAALGKAKKGLKDVDPTVSAEWV